MSSAQTVHLAKREDGLDIEAELGKLACLGALRYGLPAYYGTLLTARDETVRVAALSALLELGVLRPDHWPLATALSRHEAVRARAYKFFMTRHEYALALQVANTEVRGADELRTHRMFAEHRGDFGACLRDDQALFLATGSVEHLYEAQRVAESLGGWRAALPWAVLSILAQPLEPRGPSRLFGHLLEANQIDWLATLIGIFRTANVYPREVTVYSAFLATARGEPKSAIKLLNALPQGDLDNTLKSAMLRARAQAFEAVGQFQPAYQSYAQMNEVGVARDAVRVDVIKQHLAHAAVDYGDLPADERNANHYMMVGFPRSGTTLLENALAVHPEIETFEEIPSLARAIDFIDRHMQAGKSIPSEITLEARRRYYEEIDRRAVKKRARAFVDKLPLYSAAIKTIEKLMPGKKYIFSVRHPYDVVLSCFKQHFRQNASMDYFRRFPDACRFYDFAMSQWFDVFSLDERERVRYVRYEDLVTDFQATVTGALRFLGADWDDAISSFPALADQRAARTPSYQKVRAGLSLGLQSSWRNYEFLFRSADAEALKRWVRHFGYDE